MAAAHTELRTPMHLHLEPMGGLAGDMFAAALLDAWPQLATELEAGLAAAGLLSEVQISCQRHKDHVLTGSRFRVTPLRRYGTPHRSFAEIRLWLQNSALEPRVRDHTLAIFGLLAEAEGQVHGIATTDVTFHEVGAWDSITDIVSAAWLMARLNATSWSCTPLPMGRGRVSGQHGTLPVPAPATALLLRGFPLFQDEHEGERITPTGAAILRHLNPRFEPLGTPRQLDRMGIGFGTKTFPGMSNVLRVLAFTTATTALTTDEVAVSQFEVDDQTPEDLAVALEHLRGLPGVLDITQTAVFGKKGRLAIQVQILSRPEALDELLRACFSETSTLGIRWQTVRRAILAREAGVQDIAGRRVRVKQARRPDGVVTVKAEMDDLAPTSGGFPERERLRRRAETASLDTRRTDADGCGQDQDD